MTPRDVTADVWLRASARRILPRSVPYILCAVQHLARAPYRRSAGQGQGRLAWKSRIRAAAYDAVLNLVLDGYADLTGSGLRRETGTLIVQLMRSLAAFDDVFEARLAQGETLDFEILVADQRVSGELASLHTWLGQYERTAGLIQDYLRRWAESEYDRYVSLALGESQTQEATRQLGLAEIDSAGLARAVVHIIALFNDHQPGDAAVAEFEALGLIGKIADDLVDYQPDLRSGSLNVVQGFLETYPDEARLVAEYVNRVEWLRLDWWMANCPMTFGEITATLSTAHKAITSPRLSLAADLMLVPALRGRTWIRSGPPGLRL